MHVPGERGRAAVAAELGRGETVGAERGAEPAVFLRHADAQQPFGVHVVEILDREGRVAVVLRGAGREHARAEAARLVDQRGFFSPSRKASGAKIGASRSCVSRVEWFMPRDYQAA